MNERNDIILNTEADKDIIVDTTYLNGTMEEKLNQIRSDVQDNVSVTLRYNRKKINELKKIALDQSIKTGRSVQYTDLIKMSIDKMYFKEGENKSEKVNKGRVCKKSTKNSRK